MRIKIFDVHMNCIRNVLSQISYRYRDKKDFLDVGCGDGTRTVLFDEFERKVCGVDYKNWLNEDVKDRIKFKECDFMRTTLPYEKESFDLLLSFDVIEHLDNPVVLLKELYRLLKKDGVLIMATPNRNRLFGFFLQLAGLRKFPYGVKKQNDPYAVHIVEYLASELEKLLNLEDFTVNKCHKVFYGITGWYGFTYLYSLPLFHNIILECKKI